MSIERWWYRASRRLRSLVSGARLDRELDEELGYHVDRLVEANVARGLSPADARREALLAIGGVEQRKEECRDTRRVRLLEDLVQDVRYAVRALRRSPAFTTAAILTLTLGIGATVAMFTVVNGVLLRPMPFPRPEQLFVISLGPRAPFVRLPGLADSDFLAYRASDSGFQHVAAFSTYKGNLTGGDEPAVVVVGSVTTEFFSALAVPPAQGRTFLAADDRDGSGRIVVLSDRLWRGRFGSDAAIVGKAVTLDGQAHEVVGVMPPGFDFPNQSQAWTPKVIRPPQGNSFMYPVLGRLRSETSVTEARARFDAFVRQAPGRQGTAENWVSGIFPLKDLLVGGIQRSLEILAGAVVFVLLIACGNVTNLMLARASTRHREMGVRASLGAARGRLIRQLLTESTLLALAGGALGMLAARWAVPALLALAPRGRIPRLELIVVDNSVLALAVGLSLVTGIVFGLAPALRLTRGRFAGSLLPGGRAPQVRGPERLRAALVVGEIALALVLLTGAGLLVKSFLRLRAVDPGFRPENVVTLTVNLPNSKYGAADRLRAFHQDILGRLPGLPGVVAAGAVNWRPLGEMLMTGDFRIEGEAGEAAFIADKVVVSPGYFQALGIRLLRGRDFADADHERAVRVAIVSRTVARAIAPGEDAVGKRISLSSRPEWLTVVGVVDDVRHWGPARATHPAIYRPYLQVDQPSILNHMTFAVRTAAEPSALIPGIRGVLRSVDKDQPAASIALMDDVLGATTAEPAFQARLLGTFAMLAVALALVGTYGVLAYSVSLRTHEIGLRMALGAGSQDVLWMVIRRTLILGATGIVLGILGGLAATRLLATLLFEVTPTDPATFVGVALTILLAALLAGFIPARRAAHVDPLVALRHE